MKLKFTSLLLFYINEKNSQASENGKYDLDDNSIDYLEAPNIYNNRNY